MVALETETTPPATGTSRLSSSTVLLVSAFGAFLAFLDATIVNVAFPSIRESFPGTSIGELSWVLNAYNIVFAAFLIVCGRLADLLGRRRTFVLGVLVFTVASALCGAAPTVGLLVAARVVQALGAALLVPASLALVVEAFPEERRTHAIGLWGATAAVAAGLGPPIGGALVEAGGWRWAFYVNIPFGIAAVLAARRQLVESRAPGRRTMPDLVGAALLAAALAALTLGIVKGNDWGWVSAALVGSMIAAIAFGGLFVVSSRRARRRCWTRPCCGSRPSPWPTWRPPWPGWGSTPTCSPTSCGCSTSGATACCGPAWPWCPEHLSPRSSPRCSARSPSGAATGWWSSPGRWCGPAPTSGTTSGPASRRTSSAPGCPARSSPGSASAPPCRCSAAPPWPPCRGVATPPRPRWCPALASWAACSASRCSSSSSARRARRRLGAFKDGWVLSIAAFLAVAVLALALGRPGAADTPRSTPDGDARGQFTCPPATRPPGRPTRRWPTCRCSPPSPAARLRLEERHEEALPPPGTG